MINIEEIKKIDKNGFVKKDAENAVRRNCVGEGAKRGLYRKDVKIMKTLDSMLSEQLKDEEFRNEYEAIQPEMDVIRAIVDARTSQNLT